MWVIKGMFCDKYYTYKYSIYIKQYKYYKS